MTAKQLERTQQAVRKAVDAGHARDVYLFLLGLLLARDEDVRPPHVCLLNGGKL